MGVRPVFIATSALYTDGCEYYILYVQVVSGVEIMETRLSGPKFLFFKYHFTKRWRRTTIDPISCFVISGDLLLKTESKNLSRFTTLSREKQEMNLCANAACTDVLHYCLIVFYLSF